MKSIVKFLISFGLLGFVLSKLDTQTLLEILKQTNLVWLGVAFIFFNLSKIVSVIRLGYYLKEIGIVLAFNKNLILNYIGMFYNLFLPGGIGGDGYKAYLLNKHFEPKLTVILKALLIDRVSGLVALLFLAAALFVWSAYALFPLDMMAYATIVVLYPLFYLVSRRYGLFMGYFTETTLWGLAVQILQLMSAFFIIEALGHAIPIINFLVLFLISSVVSVLPISVGGIGVREFTFLYGLEFIGQSADAGVVFSFLFFVITLLSSLIGMLFTTFWKIDLGQARVG